MRAGPARLGGIEGRGYLVEDGIGRFRSYYGTFDCASPEDAAAVAELFERGDRIDFEGPIHEPGRARQGRCRVFVKSLPATGPALLRASGRPEFSDDA